LQKELDLLQKLKSNIEEQREAVNADRNAIDQEKIFLVDERTSIQEQQQALENQWQLVAIAQKTQTETTTSDLRVLAEQWALIEKQRSVLHHERKVVKQVIATVEEQRVATNSARKAVLQEREELEEARKAVQKSSQSLGLQVQLAREHSELMDTKALLRYEQKELKIAKSEMQQSVHDKDQALNAEDWQRSFSQMMDVHNAAAELHESSLASVRHAALCCFVAISWRWQWNRIAPLPVLWRLNMAEEKLAGLNEQPQQDLGDYPAAIHELQRTVQQTHQELLVLRLRCAELEQE